MREKEMKEKIDFLKKYDYLLRKYNDFYIRTNYLPGEYRKLSVEEKNNFYNELTNNLETINNLMDIIREKIEIFKNKKETKKIIDKIILYKDYYRDLFSFKLEYGILEYIKEDIDNPKKIDIETKYELQLEDIEYFNRDFLPLKNDLVSKRINNSICEMYRIADIGKNSAKQIKKIETAIENKDFDVLNEYPNNGSKNLSTEDKLILLQNIKIDLNIRLGHYDKAIEFYKMKLSKILEKEIKF